MSWNIVGTRNSAVIFSAATSRIAPSASKDAMQMNPPLSIIDISSARTPIVWNSGITPSDRSPGR